MLRKLQEPDRRAALDYLAREPAFNVFTIGDIEHHGFESSFQEVWGDFDCPEVGGFRAIVLRYFSNVIVSSSGEDFDRNAVCTLLKGFREGWMLSGREEIVESLAPALGLGEVRRQYLAELRSAGSLAGAPADAEVERAGPSTIDAVIEAQARIEEFASFGSSLGAVRKNFESGAGRTVFVRRAGRVVSSASSAAESSRAAMIIGVFTEKEHRGQGLASACMRVLCRRLLADRDAVCLFYDNPAAGRIYKRLGFRDVGRWAMASRREPQADQSTLNL